ncbi:MAG: hypothetical protein HKL87_08915, partial [Acidimicrobiaceae bacterium]|nr:hypothetical protein [Acidimicrobiaceae bacterium]
MAIIEDHSKSPAPDHLVDPIAVAIRTREPRDPGRSGHFTTTDPRRGRDLAKSPLVTRLLKDRRLQFFLILPNQIIFWLVIVVGLVGTAVP